MARWYKASERLELQGIPGCRQEKNYFTGAKERRAFRYGYMTLIRARNTPCWKMWMNCQDSSGQMMKVS